MREDVKQKHFRILSLRPRSVLASGPLLLRGEDFGFNAWRVAEYARATDRSGWSALSGLMPRSRHHRCEAAQANRWLKCQPSSYVRLRGLWLFWVVRGGIGSTRRLGAACSSTRSAFQGTLSLCLSRLVMQPSVRWGQVHSPVVWLVV